MPPVQALAPTQTLSLRPNPERSPNPRRSPSPYQVRDAAGNVNTRGGDRISLSLVSKPGSHVHIRTQVALTLTKP